VNCYCVFQSGDDGSIRIDVFDRFEAYPGLTYLGDLWAESRDEAYEIYIRTSSLDKRYK
jgi:hypothetical protein